MKKFFIMSLLIVGMFSGCGKTADGNVSDTNKSGVSTAAVEANASDANSTK